MIQALDCARPGKKLPREAYPAIAALAWAACVMLASYLLDAFKFGWPARLALALLPLVSFLYVVWAHVTWYTHSDELQQRIQLTVLAHAFVTCVMGAIALFYFQKAGFFPASEYPTLEYFGDVFPIAIVIGYMLGYWRTAKWYA